jgi:hypothetical protein
MLRAMLPGARCRKVHVLHAVLAPAEWQLMTPMPPSHFCTPTHAHSAHAFS